MEKEKEIFIRDEFQMMSINGAFQHNSQYNKDKKISEKDREKFRKALKKELDNISKDYEEKEIKDDEHIGNIKKIIVFSEKHKEILKEEKINFGTAQKLLNLYLKYLWIVELIKIPPHCPFDYTILKELNFETSWTKLNNSEDYQKWVDKARNKSKEKKMSIAEWELELFNEKRIN